MKTSFAKYHGLGNDYLVVDPSLLGRNPSAEAIIALCDRHTGVGADGLLFGERASESDWALRIFNPDGSEAEKSGNGLRVFARFVYETEPARPREFRIRTKGGASIAEILSEDGGLIRMDMGPPLIVDLDKEAVFGGETCRISLVSMGNPHCVVTGLRADSLTAIRLGPVIETDPRFPERTNVQFLEVQSSSQIRIELWERGAGHTLTSGSSACASAAVARELGLVGDEVKVVMPGGTLDVGFTRGTVLLTGPVAKICEGFLSADLISTVGLAVARPRGLA